MKVSIITPCYNAAHYIASTIQSIQRQTLTDWEYLLVDDGSTDGSAAIIRKMASTDKRIKLIQKENGGSASARKLGLSFAQGEYIQFLDADDTLDEEKLQKQVQLMEEKSLNVSYTDWRMVYIDGHMDPIQGVNWSLSRIMSLWGILGTLPPHCFLYRRDFLENNNITIPTHVKEREDWDFHIEVFSSKPKIERIRGYCGAFYTKSPNGKTTGASFDKIHLGTMKYLLYKIQHVKGYQKCLLYLRISIEFYQIILHNLRRRGNNKNVLSLFSKAKCVLMISLLYTPISFIIILYDYICSKLSI